ncbi:hypothetical protein TWF281_001432 [Arthrobotrys megalospora]
MSSVPTYDIDEEGDVLISCELASTDASSAGRSPRLLGVLRASSSVLSSASPVFRAMYKPENHFKESQKESDNLRRTNISVESLNTALLVMRIIHHRNAQNPKTILLTQLYDVASFADRYLCQEALSLAAEIWITHLWAKVQDALTFHEPWYGRWLWIAKVFGRREIIQLLAKDSVFHISTVEGSYKVYDKDTNPAMESFARGIWEEREKLLKNLTNIIDRETEAFEVSFKNKLAIEEGTGDSLIYPSECQMTNIAPIYTLQIQLGYPTYKTDGYTLSRICDLFEKIGQKSQMISCCRNRPGPFLEATAHQAACTRSNDLWEALKDVRQADPTKAILIAAGIDSTN